ncbi:PQQ-dependent sugar dehydrogenase [Deinococcus maricopensis]|uniref:Putative glucose/sorbosone dehydrogenase n=1 Tax=Deinococcus maricopensis (strain DSM 21211 / LMG 22137 / NRRL B-23946 / LB-34) TaxID=709986 RepID=E8UAL4_DEIML|nr:sorbosone dehydrogenase family protein [Deinococcus maricopensis]ADV68103.1 putative glucose/sorbosone dehydrogenase, precursor [Deinococcus maricopensis DSM 21211]
MKHYLTLALACATLAGAQATPTVPQPSPLPPDQTPQTLNATINEPKALGFTPEQLARLRVPAGFTVKVFAKDVGNARMMQVMPDGTVYLTRRKQGDVMMLRDTDKDGAADVQQIVAQNLNFINGITARDGKLYLATDKRVWVADILPGGKLSVPRVFVDDLPDAGQHPNRTLAWGPDGFLYVTVGSTCNNCMETNPENATILRVAPDGKSREVYARGLRNTIGFGWHPTSRKLVGLDHGSDWRGDDQPPEEINVIERGVHYGWPYCFADQQPDLYGTADPPGNVPKEAFCKTTRGPALTYTAHAAPIGMVFYTGSMFGAEYRNDAFVAMRGSWNRTTPSGYNIVRIHFDANGTPVSTEDFVSGWAYQQDGRDVQFGRVAGVAQYTDGSLLIAEDQNGVIYRVVKP